MRDLLTQPAWTEEDLGTPLPDSPHACSVALPTWDSVVGYEEGRDKVMRRLRMGYPRFVRHPLIERLFSLAREQVAVDGESAFVFPSKIVAQRAQRFVEKRGEVAARVASFHGLQALIVPDSAAEWANTYWRHAGEIVSSRQAADLLGDGLRSDSKDHLLKRRLAKLVGQAEDHLFVFASGMAAITAAHRAIVAGRAGRKTLQLEFPYVDCLKVQELFGSGVVFLNEAHGESFDEALSRIRKGEFAAVFVEIPSNPLLRTVDLPRVAEACREGNVILAVDDTPASGVNVDVLPYADLVTTSLTKWMSGKGDVLAGMVSVNPASLHAADLRAALAADELEGAPLYVGDAEILLGNLSGYPTRMERMNENGLAVAELLAGHPAVANVWYPSLVTREHYDAVKRPGGGYGGLLSFELKNPKRAARVYDALRISKGPSFGAEFSLACPYTLLAHYKELDWAESCGVSPSLIRVSLGLEPTEQLLDAFTSALAQG
jgi:cystathionine gamma-synthase